MVLWIILIILGFILLIKGADFLVEGASNIAKKFHIPEIIIGLTIVSIGTSMPELFVSITSAIDGYPDMAVGNIVGSNIANLLLILGLSSIIKAVKFKRETRLIEIPMCLGISVLFVILCNLGHNVTRVDAGILIVLFVLFIGYTIVMAKKGEEFDKEDDDEKVVDKTKSSKSTIKDIVFLILGVVLLKLGGDLTVNNAVEVAKNFGLSEKLISVTILAIGTSLPELVTSIMAAKKKENEIAVGNAVGSSIFNILFILGAAATISPYYGVNPDVIIDIIIMIAIFVVTTLLVIFCKNGIGRKTGIIFVVLYVLYLTYIILRQYCF